jgi:hypothetical protein
MLVVFLIWMVGMGMGFAGLALYAKKDHYGRYLTTANFVSVILWPFILIWMLIARKVEEETIIKLFGKTKLKKWEDQ